MEKIVSKVFLEENPYYIAKEGNMVQVRLKQNHYVMATAHNVEEALDRVKVLFQRYNTPGTLEDVLRDTRMDVAVATLEQRKAQYKKEGDRYEGDILQIVRGMISLKRKPIKRVKPKLKLKLK